MAKIQNPQNEKGEKLATEIMVNNIITDRLEPLENRLEKSFENINSGDQFISIDKINADSNEDGDFFKTTISANVTESIDDIDAETNKLVTSAVLKEVKDSIGIDVGRDLDRSWEIESGNSEENLSKVKKMQFFGDYVNVVTDENDPDLIKIYICENKNPAEFDTNSTVTSPSGDGTARYIFSGTGYSIGNFTAGTKTYTSTQQLSSTESSDKETVYAGNSSTFYTIPNKTTQIKFEAFDAKSGTVIASAETPAITAAGAHEETGAAPDVVAYGTVNSKNALTLTVSNIILNKPIHAKEGLTPGFIRCKIKGEVRNSYLLPEGGAYKLRISVGGKVVTASTEMFVWKKTTLTPSLDKPSATYTRVQDAVRSVSGITYDTAANCNITVNNIAGTQYMVATSKNRLKVTSSNNKIAAVGSSGILTVDNLNSSDKTTNDTVYSYSGSASITSDSPEIIKATITAQAYDSHNNKLAGTAKTSDNIIGQTNYLWTIDHTSNEYKESNSKMTFVTDGTRLGYAVLTDNDDVTGIDIKSPSNWSEANDIKNTKHLLIQDGFLMHPSRDVTKKYEGATGTRYYVKLIKTGTDASKSQTTYTITGSGFLSSGVKLWAVAANTDTNASPPVEEGKKVVQLNAIKNTTELSDTKIVLTISGNVMPCFEGRSFYLVVQIAEGDSKVGPITIV